MSHFYGTLQGSRGQATRCGTKNSGITTQAAGWGGAIEVRTTEVDGTDHYTVDLVPWHGSGGTPQRLADGILDVTVTPQQRVPVGQIRAVVARRLETFGATLAPDARALISLVVDDIEKLSS